LEFSDVPFEVENQDGWVCFRTGAVRQFMNELPQADGSTLYELSDTGYAQKLLTSPEALLPTYYTEGRFYHDGFLKPPRRLP
jgi:alpha-D-ribose 1-methylphosphonate 5-phosphate C-P lyase